MENDWKNAIMVPYIYKKIHEIYVGVNKDQIILIFNHSTLGSAEGKHSTTLYLCRVDQIMKYIHSTTKSWICLTFT